MTCFAAPVGGSGCSEPIGTQQAVQLRPADCPLPVQRTSDLDPMHDPDDDDDKFFYTYRVRIANTRCAGPVQRRKVLHAMCS